MENHQPADIRNFAIVGHASSGKTMLACSGGISRMGRIAEGTTVSDYHVSEKQRQISVQTSLLHTKWQGKKFNILDTPGYLDFVGETLSALRVADFALVVVHAQTGINVGTERVWNYATEFNTPKILVINAVDKQNEHFDEVLADARAHYGHGVFPLSIPINPGPGFNQVLDVLRNEVVTYDSDSKGKFKEEPATGELQEKVFKEAFLKAQPCLLEPVHNVEIRIPEDCLGKVMGDLSSRRGRIQGMDVEGQFQVIKAQVSARELYRYSSNLRSLTAGRGIHSEEFSHYEQMPKELETRMIQESKHQRSGHVNAH
jgi:small GTP-binding protein